MPMSRLCTGRSVMSWPPTWTRPESGSSKPAIMRSDVVLPQPDGPSSEKNSPAAMSSVTPSTATHAAVEGLGDVVEFDGGGGHRARVIPRPKAEGSFLIRKGPSLRSG